VHKFVYVYVRNTSESHLIEYMCRVGR